MCIYKTSPVRKKVFPQSRVIWEEVDSFAFLRSEMMSKMSTLVPHAVFWKGHADCLSQDYGTVSRNRFWMLFVMFGMFIAVALTVTYRGHFVWLAFIG